MRDIVNEVIFFRLLACSAIVALNLFAMESNEALSMETIVAMYDLATALAMTFIHCYYAENITEALLGVGDVFYHSAWCKSGLAMRRREALLILFPIQRAQQEFRLISFDMIDCSLAVFLKVR